MDTPAPPAKPSVPRIVSWVIAAVLLVIILKAGLIGAFVAGFAVYACVHALAPLLPRRMDNVIARQLSLGLLAVAGAGGLAGLGMWMADLLSGNNVAAGLTPLLAKMGEIITQLREILPNWATRAWPSSAIAINAWIGQYLTEHASALQSYGQDVLKAMTHILLGMVLGGLVAITQEKGAGQVSAPARGLLSAQLHERLGNMLVVFRQVVVAQLKISLLNTFFTAIFLLVVLPMTGNPLPFAKTMVLITFVAGLIPVLGNLISNTVITVIALSVSLWVAIAALLFLVVIHKVEYFLNAKIVGTQINAKAWELLAAMLLMESCFGLSGVIAAPIFYAYVKRELRAEGWV